MEQILGFYSKGLSAKMCSKMFKNLMAPKLYKVRRLRCRQTCFQTSGHYFHDNEEKQTENWNEYNLKQIQRFKWKNQT